MLASDADPSGTPAGCAAAMESMHRKLSGRLVPLIGVAGMRALFEGSVKVTCREFPTLLEVPSGAWSANSNLAEALGVLLGNIDQALAWTATKSLYANFLGLTTTLLGERLVLLVLQRAFPDLDVTAKQEFE